MRLFHPIRVRYVRARFVSDDVILWPQAFTARCGVPAGALAFHPFEQMMCVGTRDSLAVWEWGSAARVCAGGWRRDWGRLTSLAYLDAHHHALLAAASHAGHVCVFRPAAAAAAEPALVAAWHGLDVRRAPDYRPPSAQPVYNSQCLFSLLLSRLSY